MWGRKQKRDTAANIEHSQAEQSRTDALLARIEAQDPEVNQRVNRLERRIGRNHFAELMLQAAGARMKENP